MVVAGPGTGKTAVLTLRIANILRETDVGPEGILALTFTESGAHEMRRRLVDIIGSDAYHITISTFHGFANQVIGEYPEFFPGLVGRKPVTEVDQIHLLENIIKKERLAVLKPYGEPLYYLYPILKKISELKRETVTPLAIRDFIRLHEVETKEGGAKEKKESPAQKAKRLREKNKSLELASVYEFYQEALRKNKSYDYDDMIIELLSALEKENDLLLELQERYQYILADEHQDTNAAQNKMLELLASFHAPRPNLFVVGDEKQAIFRFQGASLENFFYFTRQYPEASVITLSENYRSTQPILDAAGSIMENEIVLAGAPPRASLRARKASGSKPIALFACKTEATERDFLVKEVKRRIDRGTPPADIAILYRDNRDAAPLARAFFARGIPVVVRSEENLFSDGRIDSLLRLLRAVVFFGEEEYLVPALYLDFFKLPALDRFRLFRARAKEKIPLIELLSSKKALSRASISKPEVFMSCAKILGKLHDKANSMPLNSFLDLAVDESGFLAQLLGDSEALISSEKLRRLYDEAERVMESHPNWRIGQFLSYLETLMAYNLSLSYTPKMGAKEGVQLMTAHRAKGLEFETVFITGAWDGHFGNRRSRDFFPLLPHKKESVSLDSDERRLFYVALTRAKKEVVITFSKESDDGKPRLSSRFVSEINPAREFTRGIKSRARMGEMNSVASPQLAGQGGAFSGGVKEELLQKNEVEYEKETFFTPVAKKVSSVSLREKKYLTELFLEEGLNVTALNNYLSCPWKYFFNNLLRIPKAMTRPQYYGVAVHAALRRVSEQADLGRPATKETLLSIFAEELNRLPLTSSDHAVLLKKGKNALGGYYKQSKETLLARGFSEFNMRGISFLGTTLSGTIDKMIFLPDGGTRVIDYKTRAPLSRAAILGTIKTSTGDYYRQLVFYTLLLSLYKDGSLKPREAEIDFIEPNLGGKYKNEKFIVSNEDVAGLSETIKKVSGEIAKLSFWKKRCAKRNCEFCALRDLMEKK